MRHLGGNVSAFTHQCRFVGSKPKDWHWLDLLFVRGITGRLDLLRSTGQEQETYELFGED